MGSIYTKILVASIVLIFIAIGTSMYITSHSVRASSICQTNNDCPDNFKCIYSNEYKKHICIPKTGIELNTTSLTQCTPGDHSVCTKGINEPPWGCVVVTNGTAKIKQKGNGYSDSSNADTKPISKTNGSGMTVSYTTKNGSVDTVTILLPGENYTHGDVLALVGGKGDAQITLDLMPSDSSQHPYTILDHNKPRSIPTSPKGKGWCLLPIDQQKVQCNKYTSDTILVNETTIKGTPKYNWGCYCKNTDNFRQNTPLSDCNVEVLCGADVDKGELWVQKTSNTPCSDKKPCPSNEKCLSNGNSNYCYTKWSDQQNTDPTTGQCVCKPGLKFNTDSKGYMSCVPDSCAPNGHYDNSTQTCSCNPGYISCPDEVTITNLCSKDAPKCIPDPCAPGGTYSGGTDGYCKCTTVDGIFYTQIVDSSSPVGSSCANLCENNNNICGSGNNKRGTCTVSSHLLNDPATKQLTQPYCSNCIKPYCNTVLDNDPKKPNQACQVEAGPFCTAPKDSPASIQKTCSLLTTKQGCIGGNCTWTTPVSTMCNYIEIN